MPLTERSLNASEVEDLRLQVARLQRDKEDATALLAVARKVVSAAQRLRASRDERRARAAAMQQAAASARKGGPRGKSALAAVERSHPIAHDIGDVVDDICEALEGWDVVRGK